MGLLRSLVFLSLVCALGCTRVSKQPYELEPAPRPILAGVQSSSPKLAISSSGMLSLLLTYRDRTANRVGYLMSHDGGDTFSAPVPVSAPGAFISAHGEMSPVLAAAPTAIYALWQQGKNELMLARSLDFGYSFSAPLRIAGGSDTAFHGFAALGVSQAGDPAAVWLDARNGDPAAGTFSLYCARFNDHGGTIASEKRIGASACPCCRPAILFGAQQNVFVAWRKVFPGDVRDMVVSASHDGGNSFTTEVRVAQDGWKLRGCPDSGPSLAIIGNRLYIAWLTEGKDRRARIELSWSDDDARHFHAPLEVSGDVLDPNHPVLAASEDGELVLAFQGRAESKMNGWNPASIFVARIDGGHVSRPEPLPNENATAAYPALVAGTAGRLFIAWTAQSKSGPRAVLLRARERR